MKKQKKAWIKKMIKNGNHIKKWRNRLQILTWNIRKNKKRYSTLIRICQKRARDWFRDKRRKKTWQW